MIVKTGLHKSGGFFQRKRSFFGWMNSSRLFPDIQQITFEFSKQVAKIVFLSVQINFYRRKFSLEKVVPITFFRIRLDFFKSFVKKKNFQLKIVSRVIRTGLYAFRGTFRFLSFLVCLSKSVPVSRWTYLGFFSLNKQLFTFFFQNLSRKLSYFDNSISTDWQNCVLSV